MRVEGDGVVRGGTKVVEGSHTLIEEHSLRWRICDDISCQLYFKDNERRRDRHP